LNKGIEDATLEKIKWLPLGNDAFWIENVESDCSWFAGKSAAQFLERLLLVCWKLEDADRDEVVMFHRFVLENSAGEQKILTSSLQVIGEGGDRTAMAKTVGLPLALGLIAYLDGDRQEIGVQMPWGERWYNAILPALAKEGIVFVEDTSTA
jgi:saccharopine dehydrogenase (NADP+, L-glutamate forming)